MAALTCGDRVREIRIRLGMSQSALANKVYFLCIDGQYFVKRLINMVTHWVIRSDNPDKVQYPDIKLSMDDIRENIEIEGRICWKGGSM